MEINFFSTNLKYLRTIKGLTLTEFGEIFELGKSQISLYENGKSYPPIPIARKISKYFTLTMDDLFEKNLRSMPPFTPDDDKPRSRVRKGNAPPQYAGQSGGSLVLAATESPPALMERDDGQRRRPPESPPPKETDTEIVNDVGKKEEIPKLRQELIDMMQRLQKLENAA